MGRKIRRLHREVGKKPAKPKFIVFCEGANTEPQYLEAYAQTLRALIDVVPKGGVGDPKRIAEFAFEMATEIRRKARRRDGDSFQDADLVWAMFDRDDHTRHQEAIEFCERHQIPVARSNPCFEVWLILHHEEYNRPDHRDDVMRRLKCLCPEYDPNAAKKVDCEKLIPLVLAAEGRAERICDNRKAEGDSYGAPSTTVFKLTRLMREVSGVDLEVWKNSLV